jgi:hypothetical protein
VPFVDTAGPADDAVWATEVAAGDAYHPSTRGYAHLGALVEPVFLRWPAEHVAPSSSGAALTSSPEAP